MLRKKFLQIPAAKKFLQRRICPTTPFPLQIEWFVSKYSVSNILKYHSDSVSPESSRMMYIT